MVIIINLILKDLMMNKIIIFNDLLIITFFIYLYITYYKYYYIMNFNT